MIFVFVSIQVVISPFIKKSVQLITSLNAYNSAVKLANCFTQQAALLAKLQGVGGQKIVVEHVEVHQCGQAVVGNINGVTPTDKEKK